MTSTRRLLVAAAFGSVLAAAPGRGDWIAYLGGGIQETRGPVQVRGRQVLFHSLNGTLLSVPASEVDLPASAFLSWHTTSHPAVPPAALPGSVRPAVPEPPCSAATVVAIGSAETLQVRASPAAPAPKPAIQPPKGKGAKGKAPLIQRESTAGSPAPSTAPAETVHLACLDAPDTRHRFRELSWFGAQTRQAMASLVSSGLVVCAGDDPGSARDAEGHRFVFVRLADGRDLVEEMLRAGLALSRPECSRGARYRAAELEGRRAQRGHWAATTSEAAVAAVMSHLPRAAGPPPPRAAAPGGAPT